MSFAYLPPTSCTCGRIIGDRFLIYADLVSKGSSHHEAMNYVGLNRICCRTTVMSATPYIVRKGNPGTISIESTRAEPAEKTSTRRGLTLTMRSSSSIRQREFTRPEPKSEFNYEFLKRGEVAVLGYERDEEGNIVMIDVGDQPGRYFIPSLMLCHGVAHHNIKA